MARLPEVQIIKQQSSRDKRIAWVNGNVSEILYLVGTLVKRSSAQHVSSDIKPYIKIIRKGSFKRDGQAIK